MSLVFLLQRRPTPNYWCLKRQETLLLLLYKSVSDFNTKYYILVSIPLRRQPLINHLNLEMNKIHLNYVYSEHY